MYQFGIVGCGRIAHRHAAQIKKTGLLLAVCDIDQEKADAFAAQYGAKAYYSIDDLLKNEKELDVISVCSPNGLHAEHTIKSLQAGKHVLCEKPMCISSIAAWQMIDTAHFFRKKLFIVKQNRYNPGVALLKDFIDKQALGAVYSFDVNCFWNRPQQYYDGGWRGTKELDGGILYTQFSHFIDLIYWLFGDVASVCGYKANYARRKHFFIEDTVTAALKMESGLTGTLHCTINSFQQNMEGSITVFGEKGTIKIGGQYLNVIERFMVKDHQPPEVLLAAPANQYGFYEGSMSNHDKVYEELVKALNNNDNMAVKAIETVKTIEIIEKIYQAVST